MDIFILDNNPVMAECVARTCRRAPRVSTHIYQDVYSAIDDIDTYAPQLIFLDIMLNGANGIAFLHELASYPDTMNIPVVIVTSLTLNYNLSSYGVVGILHKETMTPEDILQYVKRYSH